MKRRRDKQREGSEKVKEGRDEKDVKTKKKKIVKNEEVKVKLRKYDIDE